MQPSDRQKIVQDLSKKLGKSLSKKFQAQKDQDLQKNSDITPAEAAFLREQTEANRVILMQEMDTRLQAIRKEFDPDKTKRDWDDVVRIYGRGEGGPKWKKMQDALDAIEDVVEPYKGYGVQDAYDNAGATISWDNLQRLQKYTKIAMANAFVQDKTGGKVVGSAISLEAALDTLKKEDGGQALIDAFRETEYTTDTIRKLILLDDWKDIKEGAISMARELGPMAVKYLVKRYLPNLQIGADSGGWIGDYSSDPRQASKQVVIQGGNEFSRIDRSISKMSTRINGASAKYVSTFICPERFTFRRPQNYPVKTAIIGSTQELQIKTDARGNGALYLNPSAPFVSEAGYSVASGSYNGFDSFWAVSPTRASADLNFVPETGAWDTISSGNSQPNNLAIAKTCVYPGPLAPYSDTVTRLKTAGFSVNYTPTSSNNENSGSVIFGYYPYSSLGNLGNGSVTSTYGPPLGTNAVTQSQYCQMGNAKTSYRYSHIPDSKNDLDLQNSFVGTGKLDEIYCLIVTGAQPDSIVGKIDIAYDYEYIPSFDSQLLSQQEYPTQGARTSDLINVLVQQFPTLLSMTFDDAYRLANAILTNCEDDYEQIYHYVNQYMNKHNVFFDKMESQMTAKRIY